MWVELITQNTIDKQCFNDDELHIVVMDKFIATDLSIAVLTRRLADYQGDIHLYFNARPNNCSISPLWLDLFAKCKQVYVQDYTYLEPTDHGLYKRLINMCIKICENAANAPTDIAGTFSPIYEFTDFKSDVKFVQDLELNNLTIGIPTKANEFVNQYNFQPSFNTDICLKSANSDIYSSPECSCD